MKVGIFGLTGCAGDQLAVLDCEDELLTLLELVDLRDFLTASSANDELCDLDVALVEGAVLSRRDEEALLRIRERSAVLVALGTCAHWGGVAAMDRMADRGALIEEIYGEVGKGYDSLSPRALHEVVTVDAVLPGCPIEKHELLGALASLLRGDLPLTPAYPVCTECKMREVSCLLGANGDGAMCCGPLTAAGCDARCPVLGVPCIGCRGPSRDADLEAAAALYRSRGIAPQDVARRLALFGAELPDLEPGRQP